METKDKEQSSIEVDETKMYVSPSGEQISVFQDGKWNIFIKQDIIQKPDDSFDKLYERSEKIYKKQFEAALSNSKDSSRWDEIFYQADHWLKTEHPIGKVIGYNHNHLIEYLKEHFNPPIIKQ